MGTTRHSRASKTVDLSQFKQHQDGSMSICVNLNNATNKATQMVGFNLFKIENVP